MWMYLGPSCPDHPFSTELDNTEINTQIRGFLAHEVNQNSSSGPTPLREGVNSPWMSLLELTFVYLLLAIIKCQFHAPPCRVYA
jgi:hypothetical protein